VHEAERASDLRLRGVQVDYRVCEACHKLALAALGLEVVTDLRGVKSVRPMERGEMAVSA
jgi:hypothetical protein